MKASEVGKDPKFIGPAGVGRRMGLTRQAPTAWIRRRVLPPELEPDWEEVGLNDQGEMIVRPTWPIEKYPALAAWWDEQETQGGGGAVLRHKARLADRQAREAAVIKQEGEEPE